MRCPSSAWFALALALAGPRRAPSAAPPATVLVELFTSEGCSELIRQPMLLQARRQPADCWRRDRRARAARRLLGSARLKGSVSSPAFTRRRQRYSTAFNNESSYTPQMVVDGRAEFRRQSGGGRPQSDRAGRCQSTRKYSDRHRTAGGESSVRVGVRVRAAPEPRREPSRSRCRNYGRGSAVERAERRKPRPRARTCGGRARDENDGEAIGTEPAARAEVALAPDWQRANLRWWRSSRNDPVAHILGAASVSLQNAPAGEGILVLARHAGRTVFGTRGRSRQPESAVASRQSAVGRPAGLPWPRGCCHRRWRIHGACLPRADACASRSFGRPARA